jgi:hypothetical protein
MSIWHFAIVVIVAIICAHYNQVLGEQRLTRQLDTDFVNFGQFCVKPEGTYAILCQQAAARLRYSLYYLSLEKLVEKSFSALRDSGWSLFSAPWYLVALVGAIFYYYKPARRTFVEVRDIEAGARRPFLQLDA